MRKKFKWEHSFHFITLLLLGCVICFGAYFFTSTFKINQAWLKNVQIPSATAHDLTAFNSLVKGGAIWPVVDGVSVSIKHAACNTLAMRSPQSVKLVDGVAGDARQKFIEELCSTPAGERIREEIGTFNQSYHIAAIADNRDASVGRRGVGDVHCADGVSSAALFVPKGCLPNKWEASIAEDGRPVDSISSATISKTDYAFLASKNDAFFGDWKVIAPLIDNRTGDTGLYRFKTNITFGDRPIAIRTVGAVEEIYLDGDRVAINPSVNKEDIAASAGQELSLSLSVYCLNDPAGRNIAHLCENAKEQGYPTGSWIYFSGPSDQSADIEILLRPSIRIGRSLRKYLALKEAEKTDVELSEAKQVSFGFSKVRVTCKASRFEFGAYYKGDDTDCDLTWKVSRDQKNEKQSEPVKDIQFQDVAVLDNYGTLTPKAFDLGLAGLLGLGTRDTGSVAAALTQYENGESPVITLRPDYQEKAMAALAENYTCPKDKDSCGRRADLVILDAEGEDAGNVLAIASFPRPMKGLSSWDIETLEQTSPSQSPMAAYAWRNYDLRATPGSAFKLVTSIAAGQYVLDNGDERLKRILLGEAKPIEIADAFGIAATRPAFNGRCRPNYDIRDPNKMNALPVPGARGGVVFCIGNSSSRAGVRSGITSIYEPGVESGCGNVRKKRSGLCEAIKRSSNLYFAGLAMYLDADKFINPQNGYEHTDQIDDLLLAITADRLFPSQADADIRRTKNVFDVLDPNYPSTGRGRASPLVVEAGLPVPNGEPRRLRLARGGIGLSVNASPLSMASVAATIATGKIVRPHLFKVDTQDRTRDANEGEPVFITNEKNQDLADAFIDEIRQGMGAVIRKKGGTSRSAFAKVPPELRNSVFAKTGTAPVFTGGNVPEDGRYASWLVGYVDPVSELNGIDQKISFACRVAYSNSFGGSVCGPIVRDFLLSVYEDNP